MEKIFLKHLGNFGKVFIWRTREKTLNEAMSFINILFIV